MSPVRDALLKAIHAKAAKQTKAQKSDQEAVNATNARLVEELKEREREEKAPVKRTKSRVEEAIVKASDVSKNSHATDRAHLTKVHNDALDRLTDKLMTHLYPEEEEEVEEEGKAPEDVPDVLRRSMITGKQHDQLVALASRFDIAFPPRVTDIVDKKSRAKAMRTYLMTQTQFE